MTLCALAMFAWRASAQNDLASTTPAAPTPIVRTLVRNAAASGVAVDPQGRLNYAASDHVARVIVANISTGTSAAAPLVAAGNSERGSLGDGGPATSAQLNLADVTAKSPSAGSGIAIDPAGNLFIADTLNDTIRRVDAETGVISSVAGKWASSVAPDGFTNPIGAAVDATGNLYVTANNVVYRLDAQTGAMKPIANVAGAAAIAVTRDGTEIYAVGLSTGNIFQIAEAGSDVRSAGQASGAVLSVFATSSAPGPGTPAHLSGSPTGIAVDANANVFVSEATANLIERVDARTNRVTQIAGTGAAGYSGDGGAPLKAQFDAPGALAFDRSGNLFVADIGNGVIREITNASPAQASAQLWFFASNQILPVSTFSFQRGRPHHRDTAARAYLTHRSFPLSIAQPIVNRPFGMSLPQPSDCNTNVVPRFQKGKRMFRPVPEQLAVAIQKLDVRNIRDQVSQMPETGVTRTSSRKRGV